MQLKEILDVILSNRPKDAIDKIWGITVLLKLVFCVVACFVAKNESDIVNGGSKAVVYSAVWIILYQIGIAGVGTLILKRLPTSFGIGFFLGLITLAIQQNVIVSVSFWEFYEPGKSKVNKVFGMIALVLALIYTGLVFLLAHFREFVIIQVGTTGSSPQGANALNNAENSGTEVSTSPYKAYEEEMGAAYNLANRDKLLLDIVEAIMLSNRDDIIALSNLLKPRPSHIESKDKRDSVSSGTGYVKALDQLQDANKIKSDRKEHVPTVKDDRPPPQYEIYYKQIIGTEDVFHGALSDKSGSCFEDSTHIVVKVHFPGIVGTQELDLNVSKNHFALSSKDKNLSFYLPQSVDDKSGTAKWDASKEILAVTLPIVKSHWM